jgi:hypothetical protein
MVSVLLDGVMSYRVDSLEICRLFQEPAVPHRLLRTGVDDALHHNIVWRCQRLYPQLTERLYELFLAYSISRLCLSMVYCLTSPEDLRSWTQKYSCGLIPVADKCALFKLHRNDGSDMLPGALCSSGGEPSAQPGVK